MNRHAPRIKALWRRAGNRAFVAGKAALPPAAALALLASSLPLAAQVARPSADQRYCDALSDIYRRYVGNPVNEPSSIRRNDAVADEALAQCRRGNTAAAIRVLERKLADNRFTLPPRE